MKKTISFYGALLLMFLHISTFAQKGKLDFNFTYSSQQARMSVINEFLHDQNFEKATLFTENSYLQKCNKIQGQIDYQCAKYINIGVFTSYQNTGLIVNHQFFVFDPVENSTTKYAYDYQLMADNISYGISYSILYHEIFNFRNKSNFLKRCIIKNVFNWGLAFSTLRSAQIGIMPMKYELNEFDFRSMHLNGDISVNLNYELINKIFLSSVGIRFGYQFNKSGIIKNIIGQTLLLSNDRSVNLDFSGVYLGLNFSIGK